MVCVSSADLVVELADVKQIFGMLNIVQCNVLPLAVAVLEVVVRRTGIADLTVRRDRRIPTCELYAAAGTRTYHACRCNYCTMKEAPRASFRP